MGEALVRVNDCQIDYEAEYRRLLEENMKLKTENSKLKETVIKLAMKL